MSYKSESWNTVRETGEWTEIPVRQQKPRKGAGAGAGAGAGHSGRDSSKHAKPAKKAGHGDAICHGDSDEREKAKAFALEIVSSALDLYVAGAEIGRVADIVLSGVRDCGKNKAGVAKIVETLVAYHAHQILGVPEIIALMKSREFAEGDGYTVLHWVSWPKYKEVPVVGWHPTLDDVLATIDVLLSAGFNVLERNKRRESVIGALRKATTPSKSGREPVLPQAWYEPISRKFLYPPDGTIVRSAKGIVSKITRNNIDTHRTSLCWCLAVNPALVIREVIGQALAGGKRQQDGSWMIVGNGMELLRECIRRGPVRGIEEFRTFPEYSECFDRSGNLKGTEKFQEDLEANEKGMRAAKDANNQSAIEKIYPVIERIRQNITRIQTIRKLLDLEEIEILAPVIGDWSVEFRLAEFHRVVGDVALSIDPSTLGSHLLGEPLGGFVGETRNRALQVAYMLRMFSNPDTILFGTSCLSHCKVLTPEVSIALLPIVCPSGAGSAVPSSTLVFIRNSVERQFYRKIRSHDDLVSILRLSAEGAVVHPVDHIVDEAGEVVDGVEVVDSVETVDGVEVVGIADDDEATLFDMSMQVQMASLQRLARDEDTILEQLAKVMVSYDQKVACENLFVKACEIVGSEVQFLAFVKLVHGLVEKGLDKEIVVVTTKKLSGMKDELNDMFDSLKWITRVLGYDWTTL